MSPENNEEEVSTEVNERKDGKCFRNCRKVLKSIGLKIWDIVKATPRFMWEVFLDFIGPSIAISFSYCHFYAAFVILHGTPNSRPKDVVSVWIHGKEAVTIYLWVTMVAGLSSSLIQLVSLCLTLTGSWKPGKKVVLVAVIHMLILLIPLSFGGIVLQVQLSEAKENVSERVDGEFFDPFRELYSLLKDNEAEFQKRSCGGYKETLHELQDTVEQFQHDHLCCGLDAPDDWQSTWGKGKTAASVVKTDTCRVTWWVSGRKQTSSTSNLYCFVPKSCCKGTKWNKKEFECNMAKDQSEWNKIKGEKINNIGCKEGAIKVLMGYSKTLLMIILTILGLNTFTSVVSWRKLSKKERIEKRAARIDYANALQKGTGSAVKPNDSNSDSG